MADSDKDTPITERREGESHATTGGSAGAGAVTGGVVGAVGGGPVGAVVGAAAGAAIGAAAERGMHSDDDKAAHEHRYTNDRCDTCGTTRVV